MATVVMNSEPPEQPAATAGKPWSLWAKLAVSALLVWHLTAVLVGPFMRPPTVLGEVALPIFGPYLGAAYMGHSYKFFAPDPGPSHLVRYDLEFADDSHRTGVFPNLDEEWPRLFYHRHFMLSEFVNLAPPDPNIPPTTEWAQLPLASGQQQYARSYADHLLAKYDARRVTLWLQEHLIPEPEQVAKGMTLKDPSLYRERKLGSYVRMP
ncbi:MAG TPA: hypothetical protein VHD36_06075 [Pirellulales bacterium]|nr:hypothetical protein [Pirellulales bacterium]